MHGVTAGTRYSGSTQAGSSSCDVEQVLIPSWRRVRNEGMRREGGHRRGLAAHLTSIFGNNLHIKILLTKSTEEEDDVPG